jgi:WbqC-like protein
MEAEVPGTMAMHQPNYVPWLGYFHKLANCDTFVHLDAVQFPRGQSFAARNRIKTPNGPAWLTVPVSRPHGRDGRVTYAEVTFADEGWREKHLRTVEMSYGRAAHYDDILPLYRTGLETGDTLVGVNVALVEAIVGLLGIDTRFVLLSELLSAFGQKNELIGEICHALGADVYLSGSGGGREYADAAALAALGVDLRFDEYEPAVYPQLWGDFEPRLSVLDALFNCGVEGCRELLGLPASV